MSEISEATQERFTIDHIEPRVLGGGNAEHNLQTMQRLP